MFKPLYSALALLLALHSPGSDQKDKHSGRFGGLVVTATAMVSAEGKNDEHYVAVLVNIKNTGKDSACASFTPKLKTTYGLEYGTTLLAPPQLHPPNQPRVYQMLPGEQSNGTYLFEVKNGVDPLEMSLKLQGKSIRCGSAREGSWGDVFLPEEIKLDVHDLPAPQSLPTKRAPQTPQRQPEGQAANPAATAGSQSQSVETDKHSARLRNLLVKVTGVETNTVFRKGEDIHTASKDHHFVLVSLKAKNLDSNPNCTDFKVALQVQANEKPRGALARSAGRPRTVRVPIWLSGATEKPRILRLLSGAETQGTYIFEVSNKDMLMDLTLEPNAASTGYMPVFL